MVGPKQTHQVSGAAAICIGFGAIFVLLIGLLIWQPKASIWIAEAIEAEFTKVPDMVGPARFAQQPKRMPIDSREWGQPFDRQPSSREKAPQKE
jgi:hypothetical protein